MIYENVKRLCDKLGIPIYQLEARAGLGNGTIGRWKEQNPKIQTLKKVADVLGVTVDSLITEEGA